LPWAGRGRSSQEETSQNGGDLYAVEADLRGTVPEWRHTGRQPRSRLIVEELLPCAYAAIADV